jgi:hypothetical protein
MKHNGIHRFFSITAVIRIQAFLPGFCFLDPSRGGIKISLKKCTTLKKKSISIPGCR